MSVNSSQQSAVHQQIDTFVGKTVTLPCNTNSTKLVDWTSISDGGRYQIIARDSLVINGWADVAEIKPAGRGSHDLVIRSPQVDQSGVFSCRDRSGLGDILAVITLRVWDSRSKYTINVGQPILLPCFTDILSSPVDWTFDAEGNTDHVEIVQRGEVTSGWVDRISVNSPRTREYSLVINNPRPDNTGLYTCIENAGMGNALQRHPFYLDVTETEMVQVTGVMEADSVAFSCSVASDTRNRWHFKADNTGNTKLLYNGATLSDRSGRMEVYKSVDNRVSILLINDVSVSDVGMYSCSQEKSTTGRQQFKLMPLISDDNECLTNNGGCHANAICRNKPHSFSCTCKHGFEGDGVKFCNDTNECEKDNGGCDVNAHCNNTIGSYTCHCKDGYQGDGHSCLDINECKTNNGKCHKSANCANTLGSYVCTCQPGFRDNGIECTESTEAVSTSRQSEVGLGHPAGYWLLCATTVAILIIVVILLVCVSRIWCKLKRKETRTNTPESETLQTATGDDSGNGNTLIDNSLTQQPANAPVGRGKGNLLCWCTTLCCLISSVSLASAVQIHQPQRVLTNVGQPVTLSCHSKPGTSVDWTFLAQDLPEEYEIVSSGYLLNGWRWRSVVTSDGIGNFHLTIPRPLVNETGMYACINDSGFGYRHEIDLVVHDVQYSVMAGKSVLLPCFTTLNEPVDWTFIKFHSKDDPVNIVHRGSPINGWIRKGTVESLRGGEYSLVISNPQPEDTGLYTCIENAGLGKPHQRHAIFLNVTGNESTSAVSVIEYDTVAFSCDVKSSSQIRWHFQLHGLPTHSSQTLYNGYNTVDNFGKYEVRFTADRLLHILQVNNVTQSDVGQYYCSPATSARTTQLFELKQLIQDVDECSSNNSHGCHEKAVCINQPRNYFCKCHRGYIGDGVRFCNDIDECLTDNGGCHKNATCTNTVGSRHCQCQPDFTGNGLTCSMIVPAVSASTTGVTVETVKMFVVGLSAALAVLMVVIVVGCLIYCKKRLRRKSGKRERSVIPDAGNDTEMTVFLDIAKATVPGWLLDKTEKVGDVEVHGVCHLENRLYVICSGNPQIIVYDASTLQRINPIDMPPEANYPGSMAICPANKCLYITYYQAKVIYKIKLNDNDVETFPVESEPDGISVLPSGSLLVAFRLSNELSELSSTDGSQQKSVKLDDPIFDPRHAILWEDDKYLLCYGTSGLSKCGLCLIDGNGAAVRFIYAHVEHPLHLAVDCNGFVYAADFIGACIVVLNSSLEFARMAFPEGRTLMDRPARVCFDDTSNRMFVGDYGGQLIAFARSE